jgi:hypothetical protein
MPGVAKKVGSLARHIVVLRGRLWIPFKAKELKMQKPRVFILTALALILSLGSFVTAQNEDQGGRPLSASLTGAAEVPGPGDTDGTGSVKITLNQGKGQICFDLTVSNIAAATAAHIHAAPAGQAGDVVVTLAPPPAGGSSKNCVSADQDLIKKIRQNPENYYVNVHNAEFADGAIRGQLSK